MYRVAILQTMLPFEKAPSLAFSAAVARLAPLRRFSVQTEAEMALMAGEVISTRFTDIRGRTTRSSGTAMAYMRLDFNHESAIYRPTAKMLREKFLSDVAQDLRLPHTAYALIALNPHRPDMPGGSLSLMPYAEGSTVNDLFENRVIAEPFQRCAGRRHQIFLNQQQQLAPAFAALAVFDIWIGNSDRNEENVFVAQQGRQYPGLYGLDLDKCDYHVEGRFITTTLDQRPALESLAPELTMPAAQAALEAIEAYPASRLYQLAARLEPFSNLWNARTEAGQMQNRQLQVREALPRFLPSFAPAVG